MSHRILTHQRPRDHRLQAISVEDRGEPAGIIVMRFEVGQEAASYEDPTPRMGWMATGHRSMDAATARLLASRLLDAATIAEASTHG